jgi:hypothetical protein
MIHNYGTMNSFHIWDDNWKGCSAYDEVCSYIQYRKSRINTHVQGWFRTRDQNSWAAKHRRNTKPHVWAGTLSMFTAFCFVLLVVAFETNVFWKWLYWGQSCTLPRDIISAGKTLFNSHFHTNASTDGTVWVCHFIQLKPTMSLSEISIVRKCILKRE